MFIHTKYLQQDANCLGEGLQGTLGDHDKTLAITRPARANCQPSAANLISALLLPRQLPSFRKRRNGGGCEDT